MAALIVSSTPAHSNATSKPALPKTRDEAAARVSVLAFDVASRPQRRATSSRKSLTSVTSVRAPSACATWARRLPIGPAPSTATFRPFIPPARATEWTPTATGSTSAPCSKVNDAGSGTIFAASVTNRSWAQPGAWKPRTASESQMW